jgi:indoleamine 2,3-dioxygenase
MPIPEFSDGFFQINAVNGFLPIKEPVKTLPESFSSLQNILDNLSTYVMNIEEDLLKPAVDTFDNLLDAIKNEDDLFVLVALYRGYCFLASAYLLYPAHVTYKQTGHYGVGRNRLPPQISQPLIYLAEKLDVYPWLEYSYGYSLGNYVKLDKSQGLDYKNLGMANHFSGTSDETGFIMVHVDINQYTSQLIDECSKVIDGNTNLEGVVDALSKMNASRRRMWEASNWRNYNDFRVYIMGITGNTKIFPDGVIYEPETEPRYYRGQSGSQDTIIPFLDNFFRVCDQYPTNELTEYLRDMRSYRPKPFRDLLKWTETNAQGLVDRLLANGDHNTCLQLLKIYKEIYNFRNGHWQFVQKYIMANTKYPIATGGTPIIHWLPNQISATIEAMRKVLDYAEGKYAEHNEIWSPVKEDFEKMCELLEKQREILNAKKEYNEQSVYDLNKEFSQNDTDKV